MSIPADVDERLKRRALEAASIAAAAGFSGRATIPEAPPGGRRASTSDKTLPTPSALDVDIVTLPRISLGDRVVTAEESGNADLVGIATLGEGGMGRVILARQRSLARDVAVKTLKEDASPGDQAALLREGRLTGALEHPGIVPIHALGVDAGGRPLLVMKRVEGVDWETLLEDPGHPDWTTRLGAPQDRLEANLEILVRVCQTLEFAHSRGVVHRDVKAENVLLGAFGEVYLADWGIATTKGADARGDIVGTPAFMAPEMAIGGVIDERTDVYLLGALLHRVLTGLPRHDRKSVIEMVIAAGSSEPFAYESTVPPRLAELCNTATAREPDARPLTVRVFREVLVSFSRSKNAIALCDAARESLRELERRLASTTGMPSDLVGAYKAAAEARFGLTQCLRTYPEYAPAREASRRCLEAMIDLELHQGHVESASALIAEIPEPPPPEIITRLDAARREAKESALERDRLRALDRDFDMSVARRERLALMAAVGVVATAISVFMAVRAEEIAPGAPTPVIFAVVLVSVTAVAAFVLRRRLVTELNRRIVAVVVAVELLVLFHRVLAVMRRENSFQIASTDILLQIAGVTFGALFLVNRMALALVPLFVGVLLLEIYPARCVVTVGVSACVALLVGGWAVATGKARVHAPPHDSSSRE